MPSPTAVHPTPANAIADAAVLERMLRFLDGACTTDEAAQMQDELARSPQCRDLYVNLCLQTQAVRETLLLEDGGETLHVDALRATPRRLKGFVRQAARVGLSAAATVALAIGAWSLGHGSSVEAPARDVAEGVGVDVAVVAQSTTVDATATLPDADAPLQTLLGMPDCVRGPGVHSEESCPEADFDGDGDVDIVDVLHLQQQVARNL